MRSNDHDPLFTLDLKGTKRPLVRRVKNKVIEQDQFLQGEKRRVREIRAEQIEKAAGMKMPISGSSPIC